MFLGHLRASDQEAEGKGKAVSQEELRKAGEGWWHDVAGRHGAFLMTLDGLCACGSSGLPALGA